MLHMVQFSIHGQRNTVQLRNNVIWYSTVTTWTVQRDICTVLQNSLETMGFVQCYSLSTVQRQCGFVQFLNSSVSDFIQYYRQLSEKANLLYGCQRASCSAFLQIVIGLDKDKAWMLCSIFGKIDEDDILKTCVKF